MFKKLTGFLILSVTSIMFIILLNLRTTQGYQLVLSIIISITGAIGLHHHFTELFDIGVDDE